MIKECQRESPIFTDGKVRDVGKTATSYALLRGKGTVRQSLSVLWKTFYAAVTLRLAGRSPHGSIL